jgi:MEMO1 family protein
MIINLVGALPSLRFREVIGFRSPDPENPGVVLRDRFGIVPGEVFIPAGMEGALEFFNGKATRNDLREWMTRSGRGVIPTDAEVNGIIDTLASSGLLEDQNYERLRAETFAAFAALPVRPPILMGQQYPDCPEDCRRFFQQFFDAESEEPGEARSAPGGTVVAIAAPHVSFEGGWTCYRDAFAELKEIPDAAEKTYVILATSHYGAPERFGVTAKPFETAYGATTPAVELLEELRRLAPGSLTEEDFFHAVDHSVEAHVVWLQHLLGGAVKVLPVLVGSFVESTYVPMTGAPEAKKEVADFFAALRELYRRHGDKLVFVLSIDMSHQGPYYDMEKTFAEGDEAVIAADQERISALEAGDREAFWGNVQKDRDPLNWCGNAPLYTLMQAVPGARAEVLQYGHWEIQEGSIVSFAGMRFVI